ncbi:hypothetical protein [Flavobacterium sp. LC2016-01]|uniref:hypothetical protein n=1 Tax=Flavobacterium sp. LC2016-01 TaxID=2675876 RepID=UPI0012BADB8F|nr:hypothetical protein [Flavobacterium sp. LC2016-01]MTH15494.1 hypothetical protein [Flavobacterium sp. LC2016-01]
MKKILPIIFILLAFSSCSDDDDNHNPVIGNWKLVRAQTLQFGTASNPIPHESITDYSEKNIIYTFDAGSNLTISEDGKKEQYKYEYKFDYLSGSPSANETKTQLVIIDGSKWTYRVSNQGEMILGKSYVDGSDLYFVRQ